MASALLFTYGLVALGLTINAVRRIRSPGAPLKPLWLPAMTTTSLAPFWAITRILTGGVFVLLGGRQLAMGRAGLWMLTAAVLGSVFLIIRNSKSIRQLRSLIDTPVFSESLPTLLTGRPTPTPDDLEQLDEIPYHDGLTFDLIRSLDSGDRAPVLVYVHGGGWTGGNPHNQARRMYHSLARAGWIVATIRYPFAPAVSIPDQVIAIKRAIHHLRTNAESYAIDPDHVVLSGGSAGAHLAALAALTHSADLQPGFEGSDVSVVGCVPMYGIYDMVNRHESRPVWPYIDRDVMKGSYSEHPDAFHAASPIDHVGEQSPPFLVIHGTHDSLVPIAEAEYFVEALHGAGTHVEFVRVLGAQHGFDAVSSGVSRHVAALVTTWVNALVSIPKHVPER